MTKHLWEVDHPYYCEDADCDHYDSWEDFYDEEGEADTDLNLLFRFDWVEGEDEDDEAEPFNGDVQYRNGLLKLFFVLQRKGVFRSVVVKVCRADEPLVLEYLRTRRERMQTLWAPLN